MFYLFGKQPGSSNYMYFKIYNCLVIIVFINFKYTISESFLPTINTFVLQQK